MGNLWTYHKEKSFDKNGNRWHFVSHSIFNDERKYEERPFELYFRNDERTIYGVLKFKRQKDNPYRDSG